MTLYNIASPSGKEKPMLRYLKAEMKRMGIACRQDRLGNLYAVKGQAKTYPCVVAHVDEVHRHRTGTYGAYVVADAMVIGYDYRHKRMTGIGADDFLFGLPLRAPVRPPGRFGLYHPHTWHGTLYT